MKSIIIIQAQLELDTNLQDKELFIEIYKKTILQYTIEKSQLCNVDKVVLFCSKANKKYIEDNNLDIKIDIYEDNETGFLNQFYNIAKKENADFIIRVIGNNPMIVPDIVNASLKEHITFKCDYTYFKGYPVGIRPSEIISINCLKENITSGKEYARYISTSLMNNKKIKTNCFKLLEEYVGYDKVDFSFSYNKMENIKRVLLNSNEVKFSYIKKYFKPIPNTIKHIEITNLCNINCIMCSRSGELAKLDKKICQKGFMSINNFKKILDKFEVVDELTLLGGEPLLNPNIVDIIEYCVKRRIKVNLITNGLLLNRELSEFLVKNLYSIRFSIDGHNKEVYETIRKNANYKVLIDNINEFMNIYFKQNNGLLKKIGINYVYMKQNYRYMSEMIKLCKKLNIKEISFNPYCNPSFITDKKTIDEFNINNMEELKNISIQVSEQAQKFNINAKVDEYDSAWIRQWNQCEYIESFYITWDGYITPCCAIDKKELFNFGNLLKSSLEELYNSDKWVNFRDSLIKNNPCEVCKKNCFYYYGNLNK